MEWRLTVRLFTHAPDGKRDLAGYTYRLDDLREVGGLIDLAVRSGEIVYVLLSHSRACFNDHNDHHGYRGKRKAQVGVS